MHTLTEDMLRLALNKPNGEPITDEELAICDEWYSGEGLDLMKVDTGDPRILEYAVLWDRMDTKKEAVWRNHVAANNIPTTSIKPNQ